MIQLCTWSRRMLSTVKKNHSRTFGLQVSGLMNRSYSNSDTRSTRPRLPATDRTLHIYIQRYQRISPFNIRQIQFLLFANNNNHSVNTLHSSISTALNPNSHNNAALHNPPNVISYSSHLHMLELTDPVSGVLRGGGVIL